MYNLFSPSVKQEYLKNIKNPVEFISFYLSSSLAPVFFKYQCFFIKVYLTYNIIFVPRVHHLYILYISYDVITTISLVIICYHTKLWYY